MVLICQFQLDTKFQARVLSWFSRFVAVSPKRAVFSSSFLVLLVYRRIMKPPFETVHHNASVLGSLHPLTPSLPSEIHTSVSRSCLSVHCLLVSLLNAKPLLGLRFSGFQEPPSSPSLKASSTMQTMMAITTIKWHPQAHRTSKKCFKKV